MKYLQRVLKYRIIPTTAKVTDNTLDWTIFNMYCSQFRLLINSFLFDSRRKLYEF